MTSKEPVKTAQSARWPWQYSLQYRILLAYGIVFLATLVLLLILIGDAVYRADLDAGKHELEATAYLAANALEEPLNEYADVIEGFSDKAEDQEHNDSADDEEEYEGANGALSPVQLKQSLTVLLPQLQQIANRYATGTKGHVAIYDAYGSTLADSLAPVATLELRANLPEQPVEFESREGLAARPTAPEETVHAVITAAPIQRGDQLLGFVQISKPVDEITADMRTVLTNIALLSLAALAVATAIAIWMGRRLVRPLRRLEEAAFAVAEGDLTQTVPVQSYDEVGALATAFNHMVGEVRSTLERQRAFVANASHELRTPLTNIKLRSEVLRSLHNTNPQLEERYLGEIEAEADRLTRLANDLLDLARLEKTSEMAAIEPVDATPVLQRVAEAMQLRAEQAGLELHTSIVPDLPALRVRPEELEVIAANLLDNAIKYTQRGGLVRLNATRTASGVEIRVEDNGPGIPPEDMPHIFERFYRVDKARSRRYGMGDGVGSGAGLGLAIVHDLVVQNDGQIRVELAPEQGVVFVVSFPAVA